MVSVCRYEGVLMSTLQDLFKEIRQKLYLLFKDVTGVVFEINKGLNIGIYFKAIKLIDHYELKQNPEVKKKLAQMKYQIGLQMFDKSDYKASSVFFN